MGEDTNTPSPVRRAQAKGNRILRTTGVVAVVAGFVVGAGSIAGAATNAGGSTTGPPTGTSAPPSSGGSPPSGGPARAAPTAVGTVTSVGSGTFSLKATDGSTVTVDVSSSTRYLDGTSTSASLSDVTTGEHVAVLGTETAGTVSASSIQIGTPPSGRPGGPPGPGPAGSRTATG